MLKAADLFRVEGLLKHSLVAFAQGLTVFTAVRALVWAHQQGPEEARPIATDYLVRHGRQIKVRGGARGS